MGFLDKLFGGGGKSDDGTPAGKKSDKASKRRIDIDARFERMRTSVSGTMSAFLRCQGPRVESHRWLEALRP